MLRLTKESLPLHYSSIWIHNFRGFKNSTKIPLAPLTFLVGPNSSGKSSLFDAILFIAQSNFWPGEQKSPSPKWIGTLVDLGSYKDAVYKHDIKLPIEIGFEILPSSLGYPFVTRRKSMKYIYPLQLFFRLKTSINDPIGKLSKIKIVDSTTNESISIHYLAKQIKLNLKKEARYFTPKTGRPTELNDWLKREFNEFIKNIPNFPSGVKSAYNRIMCLMNS